MNKAVKTVSYTGFGVNISFHFSGINAQECNAGSYSSCRFSFIFLIFKNKFIYLSLAALGPHCCAQAFSSCSERGLLFIVVRGLLIVVASLVVEHGF